MMKMKNKKFLTRLLALLASLVLVLALALPCFADDALTPLDNSASAQMVLIKYYFQDYAEFYSFISQTYFTQTGVPQFLLPLSSHSYLNLTFNAINFNNGSVESVWFQNTNFVFGAVAEIYVEFTVNGATITSVTNSNQASVETFSVEELDALATSDYFWVYQEISLPEPSVSEAGWYGQIKNIIKDAVFGSDAVLNDSQEFTLNQIALWLSLIVILLPFVIVAVIVVRCFR